MRFPTGFCANSFLTFLLAIVFAFNVLCRSDKNFENGAVVNAYSETTPVATSGDSADDSAFYVNSDNPSKSLIIGTNKKSGLVVYNLQGNVVQEIPYGKINNVDIRYGFPLNGENVTLVAAGNRTDNSMDFFKVDRKNNKLFPLSTKTLHPKIKIYGSCLYKSPKDQKFYFFANSKKGEVEQWQIYAGAQSQILAKKVRSFLVGSQTEGCVADDHYSRFFIGEEAVGIWLYSAEPKEGDERKLIDSTSKNGHLVADVEGLALYRSGDSGYLLASSQGDNAFTIYDRVSGNFIGKFRVKFKDKWIQNTDGISITSHDLGFPFSHGMVIVQDGNKENSFQNFKMIPWQSLAKKFFPPLNLAQSAPLATN